MIVKIPTLKIFRGMTIDDKFLEWMERNVGPEGVAWRNGGWSHANEIEYEHFDVENPDSALLTKLTWGGE